MFYSEHNPPHFHARYGEYKIVIDINTLVVLEGTFPPRALGLIMEWAYMHKEELLNDWGLAKQNIPLQKIEPLR